jgi:hypothetical protein
MWGTLRAYKKYIYTVMLLSLTGCFVRNVSLPEEDMTLSVRAESGLQLIVLLVMSQVYILMLLIGFH